MRSERLCQSLRRLKNPHGSLNKILTKDFKIDKYKNRNCIRSNAKERFTISAKCKKYPPDSKFSRSVTITGRWKQSSLCSGQPFSLPGGLRSQAAGSHEVRPSDHDVTEGSRGGRARHRHGTDRYRTSRVPGGRGPEPYEGQRRGSTGPGQN